MGMFYRTIRMLEHGIKPVYVFDGKPPQLKSAEVGADSDFLWCSSSLVSSLLPVFVLLFTSSWRREGRGGLRLRSCLLKLRNWVQLMNDLLCCNVL